MLVRVASPYLDLFRLRPFRRFWLGLLLSATGDELTKVAFVWFVFDRTGSAESLGILMLCFTGPIVVGGFLAGWLLDRFDRRLVMTVDNLARGLAIAAVPLLHQLGWLEVWHVYMSAAAYGFLLMISLAGVPTMILALAPADRLATANALETLGYSLAGVVGPVIAGLLVARLGAPATVLLDVVSYLLFAFVLFRLKLSLPAPTKRTAAPFADAVHLLIGNPVLLATTTMFLVYNIGFGSLPVWLPIHVERNLGGGPELYGFLIGVIALGQIAATLAVGQIGMRVRLGLGIALAQTVAGVVMAAVLLAPGPATIAGVLFLWGVAAAPLTPWAQTLRMAIIPEAMRGRAFALLRMLMQSGRPIGGAFAGFLLPAIGIAATIGCAAGAIALGGVAGLLTRKLRDAGRPA